MALLSPGCSDGVAPTVPDETPPSPQPESFTAMHFRHFTQNLRRGTGLVAVLILLALGSLAQADPTIVSVVPANGATGVSPSTPIVFTFSEPMYTGATVALFTNQAGGTILPAIPSWNSAGTVLTYTPLSAWPSGASIGWEVFGFNPSFAQLTGTTTGSFATGTGGGTGGTGTNSVTELAVGRGVTYDQYSTGLATLDTNAAFFFIGDVTLASNGCLR